MTYCSACFYVCQPLVPFCPRCGSAPLLAGPEEEGLRRLGVLRQLVANRVWDGYAGTRSLRLQVEAIQKLEQSTPEMPAPVVEARKWTVLGLSGVFAEPDLSLRHRLLDVLCGWLSAAEAPALHDHFGRLKKLIAAMQTGAKTAAEGRLAASAASAWLEKTSGEHGFGAAEILQSLFATPHYWSKLAQAVDARQFEQARAAMLLGYGYAALANKNYPLAETNFQEAARARPDDPAVSVALGDLYGAQDQHARAIEANRRAADLGTTNVRALNNLAWQEATATLPRDRNLDLALAAAERAAGLAPVGWVLDTLAEVRNQRGEVAAAITAARAAALDDPTNTKYWERLQSLAGLVSELFPDLRELETKPRASESLGEFTSGPVLPPTDGTNALGDIDIQLTDDEATANEGDSAVDLDLELTGESAVSPIQSSISASAADSGISLDASDSGINLNASDSCLSMGPAADSGVSLDSPASNDDGTDFELSLDEDCPPLYDSDSTGDDDASEFNLSLEDEASVELDTMFEEESGSQVVAIDDADDRGEVARSVRSRSMAQETADDLKTAEPENVATPRGDFAQAPPAARDKVDCSVFSPTSASPGGTLIVHVVAHLPTQAEEARALALESDPTASRRGRTALATEIPRGSTLTFELVIPGAEIDERVQALIWDGRPESVQFFATAPVSATTLFAKVLISQDEVPIGQIKFAIAVTAGGLGVPEDKPTGEANRYRTAFASYASPDRAEVLRRVQMLRVAGIQCFQDVLDLEPGERWEKQLWKRIDQADVLFLFWSDHAKSSKYVSDEWRYALKRGGLDFIKPVILQRKPFVDPPPELKELHFNDKLLAQIDDQPATASGT